MPEPVDPPLRRRTLLALLPVGLVAACSPGPSAAVRRSIEVTTPPPTTAASRAPVRTTSAPPAPPTRPTPQAVDRAALEKGFAGRRPTRFGMAMPGIIETVPRPRAGDRPTLALTFDACGGPGGAGFDAGLIQLLRKHEVPATLFLNGRWVRANRAIARDLMADPLFAIGNHGTRHRPLTVTGRSAYGIRGTTSVAEVIDEVTTNRDLIGSMTGSAPAWFRTGTAWYDDVAVAVVDALGSKVAGFQVNGDAGATASPAQVSANLRSAPSGSIVIMHMNHPGHGTFRGLASVLPGLLDGGTRFVRLA